MVPPVAPPQFRVAGLSQLVPTVVGELQIAEAALSNCQDGVEPQEALVARLEDRRHVGGCRADAAGGIRSALVLHVDQRPVVRLQQDRRMSMP